MYIYAVSYRNPYDEHQLFVVFLAASRLLDQAEALTRAVEAVQQDALGHEWLEAVAQGAVGGPIEVDGDVRQPSVAIVVE